jgi:hypothetical protein
VPRKIPFEPNGVAIALWRETGVRAEIEVLAKALNEKMPDEVYLIPVANAAVLQRGKRRIMLLGLPILQLLTVSQFRAVVAPLLRRRHANGPVGLPCALEHGPGTRAPGPRLRCAFVS